MTRPAFIPELRTLATRPDEQTSDSAAPTSEAALPQAASEIMPARLGFMAQLEASLQASQRALLSRDLAGLEQQTSEQMRLQKALAILLAPWPRLSDSNENPTLAAELRAAEMRVLQLARIQTALLDRAQRWLRTVANLLGGVEKSYAPPRAINATANPARPADATGPWPAQPAARENQESDSCRA